MEAWFISDIHIKTMQERNSEILLRFLHSLTEKNPQDVHLFLLGDIFDLWIGGHAFFVKKFQPLVDAIQALKDSGGKITYIEGNHDVHIDRFWTDEVGIEVCVEPQYYVLNGLTVRVEHGDLINQDDKAYLRLRSVIRHPAIEAIGHLIPGAVWEQVGAYAAKKSRVRSQQYRTKNENRLIEMIRKHAPRAYLEKSFDVIISGHMHVVDDCEIQVGDRKIRSINLGSWYGASVQVLKLSGQNMEWVTL